MGGVRWVGQLLLLRTYECIVTHIHQTKICLCSTVSFSLFSVLVFVLILCPTHLASQHTARLLSRPIIEQHLQVLIVWEAVGWSWPPVLPHEGLLDSPTHCLCSALYIRAGVEGTCSQAFFS